MTAAPGAKKGFAEGHVPSACAFRWTLDTSADILAIAATRFFSLHLGSFLSTQAGDVSDAPNTLGLDVNLEAEGALEEGVHELAFG